MERAKSIDELYEEVKDYDLVICNDAPLASALNNRIDKPHIGIFAITPRQLAGDMAMDILGGPLISDIEIVQEIANHHNYPLRFVHGEIDNIRTIRRYTRDVKSHIQKEKTRYIYDDFVTYNTVEKAMDRFQNIDDPFFSGKKIAVIGLDMFDSLDLNFVPKKYVEISPLDKRNDYEFPEFRELSSDHEIAENAVDLIEKETAKDFAIVLDVNGKIADSVRSELYRKGIPFINSLSTRDINSIRDYMEFVDRSLKFSTNKVHQIRELLRTYGGIIDKKYDEYLIENYSEIKMNNTAKQLISVMKDVREYKYGELCNKIPMDNRAQVNLMLKQLKLTNVVIDENKTAEMFYAVNNFELKHNEQIPPTEKEGVLLVDCKNSVYIDRPVVIYLGMGQEWEKDLSELNLIDYRMKLDINDVNVLKFKILMQQGDSQIFICNSIRNGKEAKPCSYFQQAYPRHFKDENGEEKLIIYKRFSDISNCVSNPWYVFEEKPIVKFGSSEIHPDPIAFEFSNTSFNRYITCPRKFMFGRIVSDPDNENSAIGGYLHQYIEFRTCFPDKAKELGTEWFVKTISERCSPLYSKDIRDIRESKIRNAVNELDKLAERYQFPEGVRVITKDRGKGSNIFFDLIDKGDLGSDCNEVDVSSKDRHMHGIMDYVKGNIIFDFKTGKKKTASNIRSNMIDEKPDWGFDFQCLFYLSMLEDMGIRDPEFTFFSTSANEMNAVVGVEGDIESAMVHVRLVKDKEECVRRYFVNDKQLNYDKYGILKDNWNEFIDLLGDVYSDGDDVWADLDYIEIGGEIGYRPNKTNCAPVQQALKYLKEMIKEKMYIQENTIFVTSAELETFRGLVKDSYDSVLSSYNGEYKPDPKMECKNCDFKDLCIIDEREVKKCQN